MLRDCNVELHRTDPKNENATHSVSAEEMYNEEVRVNSIAAVAFFGNAEAEASEGVKADARGLGLLK
jgi:hypothetical protein